MILLTDHNVRETLSITDRAYLIADGRILISGTAQDLINDPEAKKIYLGENLECNVSPIIAVIQLTVEEVA